MHLECLFEGLKFDLGFYNDRDEIVLIIIYLKISYNKVNLYM